MNFAPGLVRPGASAIEIAQAYLGVHEEGAPNRGRMVDQWLKFVHWDPTIKGSAPWCAAFLVWCCHRADLTDLKRTPSVRALAESLGTRRIDVFEPGCGFIHFAPGRNHGHTGFVSGLREDGRLETLSGNTTEDGSREGKHVGFAPHTFDYVQRNGGFFFHTRTL
jgi:hypothetical protein